MLSFYNHIYLESEDYLEHVGWTGSYVSSVCAPGSTSPEFEGDVERRINYYRAVAGVPADVRLNNGATVVINGADAHKPSASTTRQAAAEQAALMFSWEDTINHNPVPASQYTCWNSSAWNAAKNGALSLGFFGPRAIDAYTRENDPTSLSLWDGEAGHRRWILFPSAKEFASGEAPGYLSQRPVNVLYVVPGPEVVAQPASFTAWPPAGYFPGNLTPLLWSLSYPGANFASATVTMRDSQGANIPVTVAARNGNFGDKAIVWQVPNSLVTPVTGDDITYEVTVSGITTAGPASYTYQTTLFDVTSLGMSWSLTGTASPPLEGANYLFDPVPEADEYRLEISQPQPSNWTEGAEPGTTGTIVDQTDPRVNLFSTTPGYFKTGTRSFRLAFPEGNQPDEDQIFVINRDVQPLAGSQIRYQVRRGYMQATSKLTVEYTTDGTSWTVVDTLAGKGSFDSAFALRTASLPTGVTLQIRFRISHPSTAVDYSAITNGSLPIGVYLDDITVTNATEPANLNVTVLPEGSTEFRFDATTAGQSLEAGENFTLNLKAVICNQEYALDTVRSVTVVNNPVDSFSEWKAIEYPDLTGGFGDDDDGDGIANGVEYALGRDPTEEGAPLELAVESAGGVLCLSVPAVARPGVDYGGEWSLDLEHWTEIDGIFQEGELLLKRDFGEETKGYLRLKVSEL